MDTLWQDLFSSIESFIKYCKLSPNKIATDKPTEMQLKRWDDFVIYVDGKYRELQIAFNNGIENNRQQINTLLSTFRQLTKRMDADDGDWSDYYDEIRAEMRKIHIALLHIDRKYKLGQHKKN